MSKIIQKITKNENEEIRILSLTYRGAEYIDIRIFCRLTDNEMIPTRKGVIFPKELVKAVIKGLKEA